MLKKISNLYKEFKHPSTQFHLELKWVLIISFFLFIPPLLLFPASPDPTSTWQIPLYQFITEKLHITIGTKGPLPFFTILTSIYVSVVMIVFGMMGCSKFFKYHGVNEKYQEKIYSLFFSSEFDFSKKLPFLEKPFIKKFIITCMVSLIVLLGVAHFLYDDISTIPTRGKGRFFHHCYNYKIGVIFMESFLTLISVALLFYFPLVAVYLFNYFLRGKGLGRSVEIPIKSKKNKNRRRKRR